MKKNLSVIAFLIVLISWQCSKNDQERRNISLRESLELSAAKINNAAEKISTSKGYQLISVSEDAAKSDTEFRDSIDLDLISGIYDFQPDPELHPGFFFPYRLFRKTGTSDDLVVNLPEQLVFHPKRLHFFILADSILENNFKITATDYHFYYNWWNSYDYKIVADFELRSEKIGNLGIASVWKSRNTRKYLNNFSFPEGYSIIKSGQTGDTTRLIFALTEDQDTLLKETLLFTGDGFRRCERQYRLSIGDVEIRKSTGVDSIQVYLEGILQNKAGAKIFENEDYNASIFYKRDILLSFNDGTEARLSELISPALETLKTLSRSLEEMYISKHIIDYIALNIYYHKP